MVALAGLVALSDSCAHCVLYPLTPFVFFGCQLTLLMVCCVRVGGYLMAARVIP